jgi:hypothetical protein
MMDPFKCQSRLSPHWSHAVSVCKTAESVLPLVFEVLESIDGAFMHRQRSPYSCAQLSVVLLYLLGRRTITMTMHRSDGRWEAGMGCAVVIDSKRLFTAL